MSKKPVVTKKILRALVKEHSAALGLKPPSVSSFARSMSLHASTLNKFLSGERKRLSPTVSDALLLRADILFPTRSC